MVFHSNRCNACQRIELRVEQHIVFGPSQSSLSTSTFPGAVERGGQTDGFNAFVVRCVLIRDDGIVHACFCRKSDGRAVDACNRQAVRHNDLLQTICVRYFSRDIGTTRSSVRTRRPAWPRGLPRTGKRRDVGPDIDHGAAAWDDAIVFAHKITNTVMTSCGLFRQVNFSARFAVPPNGREATTSKRKPG